MLRPTAADDLAPEALGLGLGIGLGLGLGLGPARLSIRSASRALPPWIPKAALEPPAASGATAVKQHSAPALLCGWP